MKRFLIVVIAVIIVLSISLAFTISKPDIVWLGTLDAAKTESIKDLEPILLFLLADKTGASCWGEIYGQLHQSIRQLTKDFVFVCSSLKQYTKQYNINGSPYLIGSDPFLDRIQFVKEAYAKDSQEVANWHVTKEGTFFVLKVVQDK